MCGTGGATVPRHTGHSRTRLPWFLAERDEPEQTPIVATMDKQKGKASGKEKEKERTLDSIMKRKLPSSGMQKGNGKGNAAATTRLPRKLTNDSSNVPIAELLYRVKKKPPP